MYTRLLTFTAATDIDGGVTYLRQEVLPILSAQHGYRGATASGNRAAKVLGILTVWETESDRESSNGALGKAREEAREIVGGNLSVENLEVVAADLAKPIDVGCSLLVTRLSVDPAMVDEVITFFKSDVLPVFKAQPGFCGLHNMVDRTTGKGIVGSAWETPEALDSYLAVQPERRKVAEARGVRFEEQESRQILFSGPRTSQ